MKKFLYAIAACGMVLLTASCSKDWLDTVPTSSVAPSNLFADIDGAEQAMNGIARLMVKQYYSSQGFNGEGTIKLWLGEYPGQNYSRPNLTGWSSIMNMAYMERNTSSYDAFGWFYYYRIINNANTIIENASMLTASETRSPEFLVAQALTYRAYSYLMLTQLYAHRWKDSNGADPGVVLRLDTSTDSMPLSTLKECYEQIYADLDEAINLYSNTPIKNEQRTGIWDPDINVAYATYARAALTREDWSKAAEMAAKARNGYALMSVAEYRSGFMRPNSEWIWGSYGGSDQQLYYYSFQAYMACNSSSSVNRTYRNVGSRELIDKFPATDIRKNLFVHQELFPEFNFADTSYVSKVNGEIKGVEPKDKSLSDEQKAAIKKENEKKAAALIAAIDEKFTGDKKPYAAGSSVSVYVIYDQRKFSCFDQAGVGYLNHFRSSEMVLIEAEAQYRLGNAAAAQKLLVELNASTNRQPGYTCSKTGDALFQEIRDYRALELWGEGFDWFDMKRWGLPIVRKSFDEGGTFHVNMAVTIQPNEANQWTWVIPQDETQYNDQI